MLWPEVFATTSLLVVGLWTSILAPSFLRKLANHISEDNVTATKLVFEGEQEYNGGNSWLSMYAAQIYDRNTTLILQQKCRKDYYRSIAPSMSIICCLHLWMSFMNDISVSMDDIHGWHFHPWMEFSAVRFSEKMLASCFKWICFQCLLALYFYRSYKKVCE